MARLIRVCERCGTPDTRFEWKSPDDASKAGAFDGGWTCSSCAWPEFDLVEADKAAAQEREPAQTH